MCKLKQIHCQLLTDYTTKIGFIKQVETQLEKLAITNDQLNQIFSFSLLLMIAAQIFNIILLFSSAIFKAEAQVSIITYIGQFVLYLLYIAELQRQINVQLQKIERTLANVSLQKTTQLFRITISLFDHSFRLTNVISIYRRYFHLSIFKLVCIDLPFLLTVLMFSLNYIVLVAETSM